MPIPQHFRAVLGIFLCGTLAAAVSLIGQSKPEKSALPLWFLAAIILVIFRFGALAGVLGTILSGLIFAMYLFEPFGSIAVHNEVQKNNLMWMVLIGLALSIFGRAPQKKAGGKVTETPGAHAD